MNKDNILNQFSPSEIFFKFLNISTYPKGNISSPFSDDKKPSFKLYKNNTFKCHSTGYQGDCFQLVAYLNEIDCKMKFNEVLKIIEHKFNLNGNLNLIKKQIPSETNTKKNDTKTNHFNYKIKDFEQIHLNYFSQGNWNVSKEILQKYNVHALDKFQYWNSKKNEITKIKIFAGVIAFAYKLNDNVELYIPKQNKVKKFFYNQLENKNIFGTQQITSNFQPPASSIIICAGKKDCLILNANGFPAVTFRSENHFISKEQFKSLKKISKNIFICYDNDNSGRNLRQKAIENYNFIPIDLPNKYNDIADYFLENTKINFQEIIQNSNNFKENKKNSKPKKEQGTTIFHIVEDYLSKKYNFRFNTILLDVEYKLKKTQEWKICNEDSLFIEMQKKGINIQMAKLISILKSDFVKEYNPIYSYFKELKKWDNKIDYISKLTEYIETPNKQDFAYHLKKWMARSVKCMLIKGYFNKQAFIITDKGNGQNIGKSHLTKWLCPPTLPLNRSFEDSKKDNLIKLATNAFIILDELDGISKKDLNSLKALFSMDEIRVRLPYARREETVQRTANFIGSTNEENFLVDPTGSVRWLVFYVSQINWNYTKDININNLWSQAYALAKDINFQEKFTKDDVKNNELRNEAYQIRTPEAEMISLLYELPDKKNNHKILFLTSTEILIYIKNNSSLNRLSAISVGRALKLLKFQRVKKNGIYGYNVVPTDKNLYINNNI